MAMIIVRSTELTGRHTVATPSPFSYSVASMQKLERPDPTLEPWQDLDITEGNPFIWAIWTPGELGTQEGS